MHVTASRRRRPYIALAVAAVTIITLSGCVDLGVKANSAFESTIASLLSAPGVEVASHTVAQVDGVQIDDSAIALFNKSTGHEYVAETVSNGSTDETIVSTCSQIPSDNLYTYRNVNPVPTTQIYSHPESVNSDLILMTQKDENAGDCYHSAETIDDLKAILNELHSSDDFLTMSGSEAVLSVRMEPGAATTTWTASLTPLPELLNDANFVSPSGDVSEQASIRALSAPPNGTPAESSPATKRRPAGNEVLCIVVDEDSGGDECGDPPVVGPGTGDPTDAPICTEGGTTTQGDICSPIEVTAAPPSEEEPLSPPASNPSVPTPEPAPGPHPVKTSPGVPSTNSAQPPTPSPSITCITMSLQKVAQKCQMSDWQAIECSVASGAGAALGGVLLKYGLGELGLACGFPAALICVPALGLAGNLLGKALGGVTALSACRYAVLPAGCSGTFTVCSSPSQEGQPIRVKP